MSQQFCLKWNNHTTNMVNVFENLLSTEALVDVTLACDGLSLKAHKMVLSACSPFFQSLFLENPCKHPIVIMKDMRYTDLKAIIDFMYRGEVNVSHDQLSALLKTAETLKVKGLAEVTGDRHASGVVQQEITQQNVGTPTAAQPPTPRSESPPMHGKRKRGRPRKRSLSDSNRSDDDTIPSKIKEPDSPEIEELSGDASMDAGDIRHSSNSSHSQSQVHQSSSTAVNSYSSKSHSMPSMLQDAQEEPPSGDDGDFEVEPSKLLEQTLTTDHVPAMSNSQTSSHHASEHLPLPSSSGLEITRRSMSSADNQSLVPVSLASDSLSSSHLQGPDSPQDIKPLLTFDEPPMSPVAGPSHQSDRSMMMYMDQSSVSSIPGPSNYQDSQSLVQHESQPQVKIKRELKEIEIIKRRRIRSTNEKDVSSASSTQSDMQNTSRDKNDTRNNASSPTLPISDDSPNYFLVQSDSNYTHIEERLNTIDTKLEVIEQLLSNSFGKHKDKVDNSAVMHLEAVQTFEELTDLNERLTDEENFSLFTNRLGIQGGRDIAEVTRRVLSLLISNKMALKLNWIGGANKQSIQEFPHILQLVIASVRQNKFCKDTPINIIENNIKRWLRYACDRDGGRTKRKKIN